MNVIKKLKRVREIPTHTVFKTSGYCSFTKFCYYELKNFLSAVTKICDEAGLFYKFGISDTVSMFFVVGSDNSSDKRKSASLSPDAYPINIQNPCRALNIANCQFSKRHSGSATIQYLPAFSFWCCHQKRLMSLVDLQRHLQQRYYPVTAILDA